MHGSVTLPEGRDDSAVAAVRPGAGDTHAGPADCPPISVVVVGRNEGERLVRCLESVRACDYPADRIELIYVDSLSSDGSIERAAALGARVIALPQGPLSAARARNVGWRAARHDLVHFFDGDTVLDRGWLLKAVATIREPGIACVFGRRDEVRPRASVYMRVCTFDWHVPAGPWRLCGGDALFRRSTLERLGGFREDLIAGEEPELCYRLRREGGVIWRLDDPMVLHDLNMTRFGQYWRRAVRSGWAYCVVAARCRRGPERLWLRENVVNAVEVGGWVGLLVLAAVLSGAWGVGAWLGLLALRGAWIAARVRRRADGWGSAVLFAGHCLFSRVPILVGQLKGLWFLVSGKPAELMEYNPAGRVGSKVSE